MDLESKNKEWLLTLKKWSEILKNDELELVSNQSSIVQEFQDKRTSLEEHLGQLVDWLSKNDIKEALKNLHSVGKVLAVLCKLPFVFTRDSTSSLVTECMLQLSDLFNVVEEGTTPEDSQRQRAKKWAIEHFGVVTTQSFSGIDHFLMEEFGISQEEFMIYHLQTVIEDIVATARCVQTSPMHSGDKEDFTQSLFNTLVMIDNDTSLALVDDILLESGDNIVLNANLQKWLSSHFPKLSPPCLKVIFLADYHVFEQYIIEVIEKVLSGYPLLNEEAISRILSESRLLEIMESDDDGKLMIGFESIMKECFKTVGVNQVLVNFMWKVREANGCDGIDNMQRKFNQKRASKLIEELNELDVNNNNMTMPEREQAILINWFNLAQNYGVIEELFLSLYSSKTEDLRKCIELVVWYFDPFTGLMNASVNAVVNHVKILKKLVPKKYLELNDVEPLVLNLKKSLNQNLSAVLIVIHVLFAANCYGVKAFARDMIALLVYEEQEAESIFWFLSAMDMLKKSSATCKEEILNVCKNQVDVLVERNQ